MADDEKMPEEKEAGKKGTFLKEWNKLAGWQKAGVLIGGGALVVAVLIYVNRQPAPGLTGNAALVSPNAAPQNMPGSGEQFPPLPVPPPTPTPTPTPTQGQPPIINPVLIPGSNPGFRGPPLPNNPAPPALPPNIAVSQQQALQNVVQQIQTGQVPIGPLGRVAANPQPLQLHTTPSHTVQFVSRLPHAGFRPQPTSHLQQSLNLLYHR